MDHHNHNHHHPSQHHHHHQPPQQHPQHHQQQHQHSSHPMYPSNSTPYPTHHMISTPNYTNPNNNNNNNNNRFPFTTSQPPQTMLSPPSKPPVQSVEPYSVSGSGGDGGYGGIDPNSQKKKRGRPRKYSPDNNNNNNSNGGGSGGSGSGIGLALSPTIPSSGGGGGRVESNSNEVTPLSDKKNRGRPSGSSKKQLDALGNCGVGFTPHVILVNAGEDIASKIVAFSKQGARTVCVLSANGSVSNVDLRQPAMSGGVVKYEGRFEIISLSGSLLFSENSGGQVRTGGLSVSLAGTDGRVLGGGVVGALRAATPVQIIVGSFIADGKKPKYMPSGSQSRTLSLTPPSLAVADNSHLSQEVSTDGSDDNGSNHVDRNTGSYGNSNHSIHHNMQMYPQMAWPNPNSKMLQN